MNHELDDRPLGILHTEWSRGWGGQEIRTLNESLGLVERGHRVTIAAQPDSQLLAEARAAGLPVFALSMGKGVDLKAIVRCRGVIRAAATDIVHTHSSVDARLCGLAARLEGRSVVRTRHLSTPIKPGFLARLGYMHLADRVITSGAAVRQAMIERNGFDPARIVAIPAGVDLRRFDPTRAIPDVRPQLGLASTDFVVGIVAVLRSWKDHGVLIEAVGRLRGRIPGLRLLIVGAGPQADALAGDVAARGLEDRVIFAGHQADAVPYFAAMDVVTLVSYAHEAFPQSLPQAMAMGKPVIGTSIPGIEEVIRHEQTGLLVPPHGAQALAEAIERLYADPGLRSALAERGRAHCRAQFGADRMLERTLGVYRALTARSSG
jgi:glycosyltransferase involved in cell wall biosynthesis